MIFRISGSLLLLLFMALTGCAHKEIGVMPFAEGKVQHVVYAKSTPWKPCPPFVPKGCEIAVLDGHPKKPDMFTVRFRVQKSFFMPAHTHPKDERVTVISGKAAVGFGKDVQRKDAREFGPGDYYVNARGAVHKVWINGPTVIQITGIGPWEAHFIDKKK